MSKPQIHTDVAQQLRDAGYELDEHGNFIHVEKEEEDTMDNKVVLPTDPNWYEELLNKRELEELSNAKHSRYLNKLIEQEVTKMNRSDRAAATIGSGVAKAELWTRDTGIPMAKDTGKKVGKATVKAGKAIRRFGKGLAAGYKAAKE